MDTVNVSNDTMERGTTSEASSFQQIYRRVRSGLEELSAAVFASVTADMRAPRWPKSGGIDYVLSVVSNIEERSGLGSADAARDPKLYDAFEALRAARDFLEQEENYVALKKRGAWDELWNSDEFFDRHFAAMIAGRKISESGRAISESGYLFECKENERQEKKCRPRDPDAQIECLMELCAAVWCGLLFYGIRADTLWNRILQLAGDETGGMPSGVCVYKAYGDVYRHSLRELDALRDIRVPSDPGRPAGPDNQIPIVVRDNVRVRHVLMDPCVFGIVDIGEPNVEAQPLDLSPPSFRRIGALYYLTYQVAYLRSGNFFTLIWTYRNETDFREKFLNAPDARTWVRYAYGRDSYDPHEVVDVAGGRRKYGFWACPRSAFGMLPCALGIRYGVMSLEVTPGTRSPARDETDEPFNMTSVPFGARRVGNDMFESLSMVIASMAEQIRHGLELPGEAGKKIPRRDGALILTTKAATAAPAVASDPTTSTAVADGSVAVPENEPPRYQVHDLLMHAYGIADSAA